MRKLIITLCLFALPGIGTQAGFAQKMDAQSIERMEPPYWWADMNHAEVQLLLYGKDLAQAGKVSSELPVLNVTKTDNDNYVFVTLNTSGKKPGQYKISIGDIEKDFELKVREPGSAQRKGFDSSDVVYLIMPDRFANGNLQNDSHPELQEKADRSKKGGRHGGDIAGIIKNLDYLEELGATAIWSTPLLEDDDPEYSYHTYAQSDVYRIDPRFGTNEEYRQLADEMHKRDMKLIMDYVTNHWGAKHWIIQDLPTDDWIHQFDDNEGKDFPVDGYANSNYRMTTQYDIHRSERDFRYCVDGWFVSTMPDLNQGNPLVLNYLIQNAIWWVEYAGLDGFRVDTYSYNDKEGIAKWTKAIMDEYPNFNIVGEVWMHDQAQISYWQKDSPIAKIQSYNSHLPSVMDFTLHDAIMAGFHEEDMGWDKGSMRFYDNFVNDFLYPDIDNLMVFAGNHDTNRIAGDGVFNDNIDKYKLAMTLILTTRGTPQIYYGDEIGMQGNKFENGDGDIRRDFPGGWPSDKRSAFTEEGRTEREQEYFAFAKALLNYRKNNPVLHTGKLLQYLPENNCYVYFRHNDDKRIMVVINNNPKEVTLDLSKYSQGINGATSGENVLTGDKVELNQQLSVAGKQSLVLEL